MRAPVVRSAEVVVRPTADPRVIVPPMPICVVASRPLVVMMVMEIRPLHFPVIGALIMVVAASATVVPPIMMRLVVRLVVVLSLAALAKVLPRSALIVSILLLALARLEASLTRNLLRLS